MRSVVELIRDLPKVELHLHIEGTLEPEQMFEFARRNDVALPHADVDAVRAAYNFTDLQSFLDVYYMGTEVLQTEQDFHDMTMAYFERAHADRVVHTELFFDPQSHTDRKVGFDVFMPGFLSAQAKAKAEFGISSELIMCFLRHLSADEAARTLEHAEPYREHIIAVGLDSSEQGHPPSKFTEVFTEARNQGYKVVAHAGEEGPPSYITEALDLLGATRIDHGVRCTEDPALVARLRQERVPLTVCPLSNLELAVIDELKAHNLRELLELDLVVTINSDDPAYFGGYIGENMRQTADALELSADHMRTLGIHAVNASFMDEDRKAELVSQINLL